MIYSELVKRACNIMFEAHKADQDKGGYPYVFHPFFLAAQMNDEYAVCAALLHDVIEDHGDKWPLEKLREEGMPEEVLAALTLLTHQEGVEYMDYVREIAKNPIARQVKIADLRHNLDTSRNDYRLPLKFETYREALLCLTTPEKR